jgi:hypothetical protein
VITGIQEAFSQETISWADKDQRHTLPKNDLMFFGGARREIEISPKR